jgi:hypothetical protein
MNCPFYGQSMFLPGAPAAVPFILMASGGNQCALIIKAHSPCMFQGEEIDWRTCPRVRDIRPGQEGPEA